MHTPNTPTNASRRDSWSPLALHCLSRGDDGGLLYRMKRPRHASSWLALTPDELLAKLATLVLPPRVHGLRYHGVFAPHARLRSRVVPEPLALPAAPQLPAPASGERGASAAHLPRPLGRPPQEGLRHRRARLSRVRRSPAAHRLRRRVRSGQAHQRARAGKSGDGATLTLAAGFTRLP